MEIYDSYEFNDESKSVQQLTRVRRGNKSVLRRSYRLGPCTLRSTRVPANGTSLAPEQAVSYPRSIPPRSVEFRIGTRRRIPRGSSF